MKQVLEVVDIANVAAYPVSSLRMATIRSKESASAAVPAYPPVRYWRNADSMVDASESMTRTSSLNILKKVSHANTGIPEISCLRVEDVNSSRMPYLATRPKLPLLSPGALSEHWSVLTAG